LDGRGFAKRPIFNSLVKLPVFTPEDETFTAGLKQPDAWRGFRRLVIVPLRIHPLPALSRKRESERSSVVATIGPHPVVP